MKRTTKTIRRRPRGDVEAGFTLVEAMIAIVVFIVGIVAVSNMFLVAAAQTNMANCMTVATAEATQAMDALKAKPYGSLAIGGSLTSDMGGYFMANSVPGVAMIRTRWTIENGGTGMLFITVRSEPVSAIGGNAGAAMFSTFRRQ